MCSFEEGARQTIKEEAYDKGISQGYIDATANNVLSYMKSFNLSLEQALQPLNMDDAKKQAVIIKINELMSK